MATKDRGQPLPKFGEWDVTNPASAEGFTVIFNKARDEKKTKKSNVGTADLVSPQRHEEPHGNNHQNGESPRMKKRWLCFR